MARDFPSETSKFWGFFKNLWTKRAEEVESVKKLEPANRSRRMFIGIRGAGLNLTHLT